MAKPFKPPPISDQIINTINPVNWFSGLIWSNVTGDFEYHLSARDHRKVQYLPPIAPVDIKESAGFGPASISIDPRKWFKYGFANGFKGEAKKLLKFSLSADDFDAHSDWIHGWKPKLVQEVGNTNTHANELGLVRKKIDPLTLDTYLEGWVNSASATEDEKQSRLKLYNKLEWWTKTEAIKPYRDLAWKPIMENAIEAAYFTAERQKNEGKITQAEFDHFKSEFDRVANKEVATSVRSTAGKVKSFRNTEAGVADVRGMFTNEKDKNKNAIRDTYYASIRADQDYNRELHVLFKQIVGDGHGGHDHGIINLEHDDDGIRLLKNLSMLDHGESHFAWKDFLQKFDKGGTLRDYVWDSVTSADIIRIAEPIYAIVTGGKTMSPRAYKVLGRISQVGAKTFPFNAGLIVASIANKSGYFGLSSPNNYIRFNNFAFLEFKEGRLGIPGLGARFMANQFEGVLWNKAKKDGDSLYKLLLDSDKEKKYMYAATAAYFKELDETRIIKLSKLLLTPDDIIAGITPWLDPALSAKDRAKFLADLQDKINKYKVSEGYKTLKDLVRQGKLKDYELFPFLALANLRGLSSQYQGFVGFASKLPDQLHNFLQTWSGKIWEMPGFKQLFPIWSKYKLSNLFFNNPFAMKLGAWLAKLIGGAIAGPLGTILGYLIEDLVHKFTHNIWASLTGGHPHALIGDNTKKMFVIGCAIVLAILALPIFIIIIILGGAFALFTGGSSADDVVANQDVTVIVENLDTPIKTIANNTATAQQTKFDITIKNNLDKEITVLSVTISEYSEEPYWQGTKTITYDKQVANNIKIRANDKQTTNISLPFYNAVKNGEEGRLIYLTINTTYVQTDGGAGSASGSGTLLLGKVEQPIGTPYIVNGQDKGPSVITQCYHSSHKALDIGVIIGTPLHSTLSGVVTVCNMHNNLLDRTKPGCPHQKYMVGEVEYSTYGNMVIVTNGAYTIRYAHLRDINTQGPSTPSNIVDGKFVNVGDVIGYSGSTGNSEGPHVHYEVRDANGVFIDPWQFVSSSSSCRVTL